jgi:hypothetical protein
MLTYTDIVGGAITEELARRVLAVARPIAPCIATLADSSEEKADAVAILQGIARDGIARGARSIKSQSIATARVEYTVDSSWFSADDRSALRALCAASTPGNVPVGSFPKPSAAVSRMWPEDC